MENDTTRSLDERWPASITKPPLPSGYEWVCLNQAIGLRNDDGGHPWFIRLCWTMKNGKKRMLKTQKEYFPTPHGAIAYAVAEAEHHSERQKL